MTTINVSESDDQEKGIPIDILDDLSSRFIINVPEDERNDLIRICFQIELAHWFFIDFYCSGPDSVRKPCGIREFARHIFGHIPFLKSKLSMVNDIISDWRLYKSSVPTFGAILLDEDMSHVLLVKSYFSRSSWGFPKGKVNKDETPYHCAIREVYEETGFNITSYMDPSQFIEATVHDQVVRLYIIRGINKSFHFQPLTRNEIKAIGWFPVSQLPIGKKDPPWKLNGEACTFFMVAPFLRKLRQWIFEQSTKTQRGRRRQRYKSCGDIAGLTLSSTGAVLSDFRNRNNVPEILPVSHNRPPKSSSESSSDLSSEQSSHSSTPSDTLHVKGKSDNLKTTNGLSSCQSMDGVMSSYTEPTSVMKKNFTGYVGQFYPYLQLKQFDVGCYPMKIKGNSFIDFTLDNLKSSGQYGYNASQFFKPSVRGYSPIPCRAAAGILPLTDIGLVNAASGVDTCATNFSQTVTGNISNNLSSCLFPLRADENSSKTSFEAEKNIINACNKDPEVPYFEIVDRIMSQQLSAENFNCLNAGTFIGLSKTSKIKNVHKDHLAKSPERNGFRNDIISKTVAIKANGKNSVLYSNTSSISKTPDTIQNIDYLRSHDEKSFRHYEVQTETIQLDLIRKTLSKPEEEFKSMISADFDVDDGSDSKGDRFLLTRKKRNRRRRKRKAKNACDSLLSRNQNAARKENSQKVIKSIISKDNNKLASSSDSSNNLEPFFLIDKFQSHKIKMHGRFNTRTLSSSTSDSLGQTTETVQIFDNKQSQATTKPVKQRINNKIMQPTIPKNSFKTPLQMESTSIVDTKTGKESGTREQVFRSIYWNDFKFDMDAILRSMDGC